MMLVFSLPALLILATAVDVASTGNNDSNSNSNSHSGNGNSWSSSWSWSQSSPESSAWSSAWYGSGRNTLAVLKNVYMDLHKLKAKLEASGSSSSGGGACGACRKVGFRAQFSADTLKTPASGPYKFDNVIFNDGNGYDKNTGLFTAPHAGAYLFTFQLFTVKKERPMVNLKVNDGIVVRMAVDTTTHDTQSGSTSNVLSLNAGDRVKVENAQGGTQSIHGKFHTVFSGALLYSK